MNTSQPRSRRHDILPYLRRGDQVKIAERARCHPTTVSAILSGRQSQTSELAKDVIAISKEYAQRNNPYALR